MALTRLGCRMGNRTMALDCDRIKGMIDGRMALEWAVEWALEWAVGWTPEWTVEWHYVRVFQDRPGYTTLTEHHIPTEHTTPVRLPPYRIPRAFKEEVHKELKEMMACGIIEPCTSEWASPMVTVKKKIIVCVCALITGA